MSNHWKIETTCEENKKVEFECSEEGVVRVISQERDVKVLELSMLWDMVKTMNQSKYIKMECTKLP